MTTSPPPQALLRIHLATWILKITHWVILVHAERFSTHALTYILCCLYAVLLGIAVVILGSLCGGKPTSKAAPSSNPVSEESVLTWIQDSSASQPVKCEMPPYMFCCRQEGGWVWIIKVAFVLVSGPHQHWLMVGLGACKNGKLLNTPRITGSCWKHLPVLVYIALMCIAMVYFWFILLVGNLKPLLSRCKIDYIEWLRWKTLRLRTKMQSMLILLVNCAHNFFI